MKLKRAWIAICCRCGKDGITWHPDVNITQDRAEAKLREAGWGTHLGDPICPKCKNTRPGVVEVIKTLKSAAD